MKNSTKVVLLDTVCLGGLTAGGLGLEVMGLKLLGKIWQKHELTDEFVENHPVLGFLRITLRIFITLVVGIGLAIAPVTLLFGKICRFIESKFPYDVDEEEK